MPINDSKQSRAIFSVADSLTEKSDKLTVKFKAQVETVSYDLVGPSTHIWLPSAHEQSMEVLWPIVLISHEGS